MVEKLVRPFQSRDISPPKKTSSGTTDDGTFTVQWGQNGTPKLMFGSVTIDETFYAIKNMREKPRDDENSPAGP